MAPARPIHARDCKVCTQSNHINFSDADRTHYRCSPPCATSSRSHHAVPQRCVTAINSTTQDDLDMFHMLSLTFPLIRSRERRGTPKRPRLCFRRGIIGLFFCTFQALRFRFLPKCYLLLFPKESSTRGTGTALVIRLHSSGEHRRRADLDKSHPVAVYLHTSLSTNYCLG